MNKFAKALLLALVFAAPVAIFAPAVQASPVTTHQQVAQVSTQNRMAAKKRRTRRTRRTRKYLQSTVVPNMKRHLTVATISLNK
jgi:uncharacterized protein YfaQ (DUF2300 family)